MTNRSDDAAIAKRRGRRGRRLRPAPEALEGRQLLTIRFGGPVAVPTGRGPQGVLLADFNGDSELDLVVADTIENDLNLRLGRGDGSFGPATAIVAGSSPVGVAASDVDGDGALDLLATNYNGNNVSVFLGHGDGTFAPKVNYASGGGATQSVDVADLDGDGKLDLILSNVGPNVSILYGEGDGTFSEPVTFDGQLVQDSDVEVADFNGDGKPDLAVASYFSALIYLNLGGREFAPGVSYNTHGGAGYSIESADLDGDGKLDLVQSNSANDNIAVFMGRGDGTFEGAFNILIDHAGGHPFGLALDDFDNDGHVDIIIAAGGGLRVLAGRGNGTFEPYLSLPFDGGYPGVAAGDLNGDGRLDLVASGYDQSSVTILLNTSGDPPPAISVADASTFEGDEGPKILTFEVALSASSAVPVSFDYTTQGDSAVDNVDYGSRSGTVIFLPGQTRATIEIPIAGDPAPEPDETFRLLLSNPTGASLADDQALGTILNDDHVPLTISIQDAAAFEGDEGITAISVNVSLSAPAATFVTVRAATQDGLAKAGSDYYASFPTVVFAPGQTLATVVLSIRPDRMFEGDEWFFVVLANPSGAALADDRAEVTIANDDPIVPIGGPTLSIGAAETTEGDFGSVDLIFPIALSSPSIVPVTVDYSTANLGTGPGFAAAGFDYTPQSGRITFAPGETYSGIRVSILGDRLYEGTEQFAVNLFLPKGADLGNAQAVGSIRESPNEVPRISISAGSVSEGASTAFITASLSNPAIFPIHVWVKSAQAASSGMFNVDAVDVDTVVTFAPGETTASIPVSLVDDALAEDDETLVFTESLVDLSTALGDSPVAVLTIVDNDRPSVISMAAATMTVDEKAGSAAVSVRRTDPTRGATVAYTVTRNPSTSGGTPDAPISGQLTFAAGEATKSISFAIDDLDYTPDRSYMVTLGTAMGGAVGATASTKVSVVEDDPPYVSVPAVAIRTKGGKVAALTLGFAAPIDAAKARKLGAYRLILAGKDAKFGTGDDRTIRLRSAVPDALRKAVTIRPVKPFAARPAMRLILAGDGMNALTDPLGRAIDGDGDGKAGGDAVVTIGKARR